ncbi:ABC transporter permease [Pseudothermotoga elfii]
MNWLRYSVSRLISSLIVIFGVILVVYVISAVVPSDPAALWVGPHPTYSALQNAREKLKLDLPLFERFFYFFKDLLRGDLGISIRTHNPVSQDIFKAFGATFELILFSEFLAIIIGIILGVYAGVYQNKLPDSINRIFAVAGVSLPGFWFGMILQLIFFKYLGILPLSDRIDIVVSLMNPFKEITGFYLIDTLIDRNIPAFVDVLKHLILPAITLSVYPIGLITRQVRSMMIEVLNENYIRTSIAYGIPKRKIYFQYALKNAIAPAMVTVALSFAYTLVGAFLVELIFNWPGLGRYAANSILSMDYPAIVGVTLVVSITYVLINFVVDILQAKIDPRIKY